MTSTLSIARKYVASGLSVIPIKLDGSKSPATENLPKGLWSPFQKRMPTDQELSAWFRNGQSGVAIVGGGISGNLDRLDFDKPGVMQEFEVALEVLHPELIPVLHSLPLVVSPRDASCGHIYARLDGPVQGNRPLARERTEEGELKTLIETRGEGGYTVAPGSPSAVHETGTPYKMGRGSLSHIPVISVEDWDQICSVAKALDRCHMEDVPFFDDVSSHQSRTITEGELLPGQDYNLRGDYEELLEKHGWQPVGAYGGWTKWKRPGKTGKGSSAQSGEWNGRRVFVCYSSNAGPFAPDPGKTAKGFSPWAVHALLEHDGDFRASASALYHHPEKYGARVEPAIPLPTPTPTGNRQKKKKKNPTDDTAKAIPSEEQAEPSPLGNLILTSLEGLPAHITDNGILVLKTNDSSVVKEAINRLFGVSRAASMWANYYVGCIYNSIESKYGARGEWLNENYGDRAEGMKSRIALCGRVARQWSVSMFTEAVQGGMSWSTAGEASDTVFSVEDQKRFIKNRSTVSDVRSEKKAKKPEAGQKTLQQMLSGIRKTVGDDSFRSLIEAVEEIVEILDDIEEFDSLISTIRNNLKSSPKPYHVSPVIVQQIVSTVSGDEDEERANIDSTSSLCLEGAVSQNADFLEEVITEYAVVTPSKTSNIDSTSSLCLEQSSSFEADRKCEFGAASGMRCHKKALPNHFLCEDHWKEVEQQKQEVASGWTESSRPRPRRRTLR